jgi:hypothetical protein
MRIFLNIPIELEHIIWIYTGLFKLRNGILIFQIKNRSSKIVDHLNNLIDNYNKLKYYIKPTLTNVIYLCHIKIIKDKDKSYKLEKIIYPNKIMYLLSVSNCKNFDSSKYISQYTLR